MKKNPELFDHNGKLKKPPQPKKKRPKTPKKPDPPEDPLPFSPHRLHHPIEPIIPFMDPDPHIKPTQMRLPEDPPTEPNPVLLSGIYQPIEPIVPISDDIIPRPLECYDPPYDPFTLREPYEPYGPRIPEANLREVPADQFCEQFEEPVGMTLAEEPGLDRDNFSAPPSKPLPFMMPPELAVNKENSMNEVFEPMLDPEEMDVFIMEDASLHYSKNTRLMRPKTARPKTAKKEFANAGTSIEEEKKEHPEGEEEVKGEEEDEYDDELSVIDEEVSDDDVFSCHEGTAPGKVTIGIQTSKIHFKKIDRSKQF